ncbi:MAG: transporter substrate-binding domain-containing protein [Gammaproteobacteria bacterium]|jgi:polar amino acid transport system substrate-binding protein|nr:transporter substrate-binding domain-containing protein [Gammaproteobacteria bacterium]MBU2178361.1 transporter substrate-binding domain-containing protein [Gammaproteobacteria bacterium]MBU2224128.1 transporter substrate-binding domain-containing protein [Gammaproteobacteria bacterium]MBU2279768.1 transporter substrate-binding domain-containing protein [Gammaproteobacteria bacterium]MBU2427151.1 transporter substrate-binding domain-containing protein [Gammaproteobacteria bacterium]
MAAGAGKLMFFFRLMVSFVCLLSLPVVLANAPTPLKPLAISAGEWPPYLGADLPEQGMAARLIRDIFKDAGYQVTFQFLPWARAYQDSKQGRYAATAVWMKVPSREQDFWFSDAVLNETFVFFHLKSNPLYFESLADLANVRLGGGLGYSYGIAFDTEVAKNNIDISRVGDTAQNFRRLAKGRIQAFPEEMHVGYHVLKTQLPELAAQIDHNPKPLLINQSFVLFPKTSGNSEQLQQLFNHGLANYRANGRYQQYFNLP